MKLSEKEKKRLSAKEILEIVKKSAGTKFDESVDVSLRINVKQSKGGDFSLRTVVKLPNGSGKKEKVAVLCDPDKIEEAKKSGAEVYGSEDLIEKIASSKFDFTKLICTPSMMSKIGKHGKILGPKGLMPNPKLGTVSNDITKAVKDIKTGLVEIRNDKDGNLASTIGRKSYSAENLLENYNFYGEFSNFIFCLHSLINEYNASIKIQSKKSSVDPIKSVSLQLKFLLNEEELHDN